MVHGIIMVSDKVERPSVKFRRILFRKDSKIDNSAIEEPKHKFIVMKMSWDQALEIESEIKQIIDSDPFLKNVEIRNLKPEDTEIFIRVYNRVFITAPDPFRRLKVEDIEHFDPQSTFVAVLYGQLIGFVYLLLEPLIKQSKKVGTQGIIAGIGVDPRYRRKKIAFLLAARAADYFQENSVDELVCEVYHTNRISYSFIKNFGMTKTGEILI
jgi:ribosomal protein S18 acetylase RimI-like enzyme